MRLLTTATALLCASIAFSSTAYADAEVGKTAPAFSVKAVDGSTVSPADYKGKVVVVEWTNPGCPFVHKHYDGGSMQKLQAYAKSKGVVWLTVNSSGPGKEGSLNEIEAKDYILKSNVASAHYILDPKGDLGKLYGAKSTPHMFVIDPTGNIAYMGAIDDQPTPDPESLKTADNYVRDAIDALQAGKPVKVAFKQAYGCSVKYAD